MDHDVRCDLNALDGLPDRSIDQTIRSLKPHLFAGGAGDEPFKLGDLRTIVKEKITEHLDQAALDSVMVAQESDRRNLDELLQTYDAGEMPQ